MVSDTHCNECSDRRTFMVIDPACYGGSDRRTLIVLIPALLLICNILCCLRWHYSYV